MDFFLLEDLVDASGRVRFFTDFDAFAESGLPRTLGEYARFKDASISFIRNRNLRIAEWANLHLNPAKDD